METVIEIMGEQYTIDSIKTFKNDLKRHTLMSVLFIFFYFVTLTIGSFVFFYIEECYDVTPKQLSMIEQRYLNMCHLVKEIHDNQTCAYNRTISMPLIEDTLDKCDSRSKELSAMQPKCELTLFSFYKWMDYSGTICYTIGYGNIVTTSSTGKVVTMIYAIPGISVTMVMNLYIGNIFVDATKILLVLFHTKILNQIFVLNLALKVFLYQFVLAILTCVSYGVILQKYVFDLTLIDTVYFSFITFSTIGFGDINYDVELMVSKEIGIFPRIAGFLVFFIGMGVMASVLSGLSELFTKDKRERRRKKKPFITKMLKKFVVRTNIYELREDNKTTTDQLS